MGEISRGFESNYLRIDLCCIHAKTVHAFVATVVYRGRARRSHDNHMSCSPSFCCTGHL